MQPKQDNDVSGGSAKRPRDRYWSLMLVGEHGRITPIPRARAIVIASLCILVLAISGALLFGMLYMAQIKKNLSAREELEKVEQKMRALRDEKDELVAKLVLYNAGGLEKKADDSAQAAPVPVSPEKAPDEVKRTQARSGESTPKQAANTPAPDKIEAPKKKKDTVKPGATTRQFKVRYIAERNMVQAKFRIYNKSRPKHPLSGRIVVVFSSQDDPPSHWIPSPTVQLKNGEPTGTAGQAFKINNFRTVEFNVYGQKPPVKLNSAVVYVFTADGELILSESHSFEIDVKPPAQEEKKPAAEQTKPLKPEKSEAESPQAPEPEVTAGDSGADVAVPEKMPAESIGKTVEENQVQEQEQASPEVPDRREAAQSPQEQTGTQSAPAGDTEEQSQGADSLETR